jgi:hypothetical protein
MINTLKNTKEESPKKSPTDGGSLKESDSGLWDEAIKHHKYQLRMGMSAAREAPYDEDTHEGGGYYFDYGANTPQVNASKAALEDIIAQIMSSEGLTRDQVEYKLNASSDSRDYLPDEYK